MVRFSILTLNSLLSIYPNPAKNILHIKLPLLIKETTLLDIMGRERLNIPSSATELNINLENIKPGMYFVKVQSVDGRNAVRRVVIE